MSIGRKRELFTYQGVLEQIMKFLVSDGSIGLLRCECTKPLRNEWAQRYPEDPAFAQAVGEFFKRGNISSVLELGSGDGFMSRTVASHARAYAIGLDESPWIPATALFPRKTVALFNRLVLTAPLPEDLGDTDWVMSFGIAEHVPLRKEPFFIMNVLETVSRQGLILTWKTRGATGNGLNCRNPPEVIRMFEAFGFQHDMTSTRFLRYWADKLWNKAVLVFRRPYPRILRDKANQPLQFNFQVSFRNGVYNNAQINDEGTHLHWQSGHRWIRAKVPSNPLDLLGE